MVQPKPDPSKIAAKKGEEEEARDTELNDLFKIAVSQPKVLVEMMEDWDQETLEKVVESKEKEYNQNKPTEIQKIVIVLAVLEAWWASKFVLPMKLVGCHFIFQKFKVVFVRHALPPGYVLKSQMKALITEEAEKMPVEDEIEDRRSKLTKSTPVTPELFVEWKEKKIEEWEAGLAVQQAERAKND